GQPLWIVELSSRGGTTVACPTGLAVTGEGVDGPVCPDDPHPVARRVRDVDVAGMVDGRGDRMVELGLSGQPAVAAGAMAGISGDDLDFATGGDPVHLIAVDDQHRAGLVQRDATRLNEPVRRGTG